MVKNFPYTAATIAALEETISADRLSSYLQATANDTEAALQLYAWNGAISAALYTPLQGLEVTLRNALHRELSRLSGAQWYNRPTMSLAPGEKRRIQQAKDTLTRNGKPITASRMIAELSLGFWVALLGAGRQGSYHNQLWTPALHRAFPHTSLPRKQVHKPMYYLSLLRNRIAHHEPIFTRHLAADYASILQVISWISPEKAAWVQHHNTFNDTLAERPAP